MRALRTVHQRHAEARNGAKEVVVRKEARVAELRDLITRCEEDIRIRERSGCPALRLWIGTIRRSLAVYRRRLARLEPEGGSDGGLR